LGLNEFFRKYSIPFYFQIFGFISVLPSMCRLEKSQIRKCSVRGYRKKIHAAMRIKKIKKKN
jgi:hypothetical protein